MGQGTMNPESTFRRVTQGVAGVLFLSLGVLVATGFGGFANYSAKVRWLIAGLIVLYGLIRVRGVLRKRPEQG